MRKIVFHCQNNTIGTDSWYFVEVYPNITSKELDDLAYGYALDNAESYGIYPPCDDDTDDEAESADDSIEGSWYDYVSENHDMYTTNGVPSWSKC